jgi:TRAP-type uncharacterized transport system substrate-binding protein
MPRTSKQISLRSFIQSTRWKITILLVVGIGLILLGLFSWWWTPGTSTHRVRISGGIPSMNRHKVAEYLKRHGRELNLEFEIRPTEGTVEAIKLLEARELDLALINGLLRFPDAKRIRQVATLTFESLHLLVKSPYAKQVANDYRRLGEISFNLGPDGSETALIAGSILEFLRLEADRDIKVTRHEFDQLMKMLDELKSADSDAAASLRTALPDAIMITSTIPSDFVDQLVQTADYDLVPIHFARAFAQIPVDEEDFDRDHVDQIRTVAAEIPAYTYGGADPTPETDCPTLAAPLIIVAHEDVPNKVVSRLLDAIYSGAIARLYRPPAIDDVAPTYPWHVAAVAYRDKDKPLVRADVAELLRQIITGLGPLLGGCLALYGYYRWRQLLRFLEYFRELEQYDLAAKGLVDRQGLAQDQLERTRQLEEDLVQLQQRVVDDFCTNYFYGEGVLGNFLSLMHETRDFLRRSRLATLAAHPPPSSEPDAHRDHPQPRQDDPPAPG